MPSTPPSCRPSPRRGSGGRSTRNPKSLRDRIAGFLQTEIDFISHPSFTRPEAEQEILGDAPVPTGDGTAPMPKDMPAHLSRLCDGRLLGADEEQQLFRRMNYLKFRANSLRCRLDPEHSTRAQVEQAEEYLRQARLIRDRLVRSNMRLVISIVKKFVTPQQSFDDLLSEGSMSLLQAVEKFDFSRGFRFSTYAYRAIARNAFRNVTDRQKESARFVTGSDERIFNAVRDEATSPMSDQLRDRMRQLLTLFVDRLDRREQFILRSRYALGAHRRSRTFQCLADKLGVSKERVRQLEQRAVAKLKSMAAEVGLDEWTNPSAAGGLDATDPRN